MSDTVATTEEAGAMQAPNLAVTIAPKPKSHFFSRFTMRAALVVGGQARPDIESLLMFGLYRENPRLVVKTNDPADENNTYGKITAGMDPVTWKVLGMHIDALCKNPIKDVRVIENSNLYKGNQRFDEPQLINRTLVGRDDDGRIWIKIVEDGRPTPVFYFGPPKFHRHLRMDKTEVPVGESSQMYAAATFAMLDKVMSTSMGKRDDGEEDASAANAKGQGDGGASGGFNRGQGGGGGWQNRQGGGGGGGWQQRNGGGFNRGGQGGGGGWQNRGGNGGGQGGGWQNRQGGGQGGGGNWNRGNGGGNGGGGAPAPATSITNDDITF